MDPLGRFHLQVNLLAGRPKPRPSGQYDDESRGRPFGGIQSCRTHKKTWGLVPSIQRSGAVCFCQRDGFCVFGQVMKKMPSHRSGSLKGWRLRFFFSATLVQTWWHGSDMIHGLKMTQAWTSWTPQNLQFQSRCALRAGLWSDSARLRGQQIDSQLGVLRDGAGLLVASSTGRVVAPKM